MPLSRPSHQEHAQMLSGMHTGMLGPCTLLFIESFIQLGPMCNSFFYFFLSSVFFSSTAVQFLKTLQCGNGRLKILLVPCTD